MLEPVITNLHRVAERPNAGGSAVVARFTCRVGGVLLLGVKLVRRPEGDLAVANVVTGGGRSQARGVVIEDDGLRAAILATATVALALAPAAAVEPDEAADDAPRRHRGRRSSRG